MKERNGGANSSGMQQFSDCHQSKPSYERWVLGHIIGEKFRYLYGGVLVLSEPPRNDTSLLTVLF